MTRLALLADLHGNFHLPPPKDTDLFVFAGDFFARVYDDPKEETLHQYHQLPALLSWLREIPAKEMFFVSGNHDYIFRALGEPTTNYLFQREGISATYLENSVARYKELSIWGTPHVASSPDGRYPSSSAFVLSEDNYQEEVLLPEADIIISHNSPWYDFEPGLEKFVDSKKAARHLRSEIMRSQPRLVVSGHFHWMRGEREIGDAHCIVPSAVMPYLPGVTDYQVVSEDPYFYCSLP